MLRQSLYNTHAVYSVRLDLRYSRCVQPGAGLEADQLPTGLPERRRHVTLVARVG